MDAIPIIGIFLVALAFVLSVERDLNKMRIRLEHLDAEIDAVWARVGDETKTEG